MNLPEIMIGVRKVGLAHPPLVVAELGINHGGSLETALELAKRAVESGGPLRLPSPKVATT